jgi:hypothetical protein
MVARAMRPYAGGKRMTDTPSAASDQDIQRKSSARSHRRSGPALASGLKTFSFRAYGDFFSRNCGRVLSQVPGRRGHSLEVGARQRVPK